MLGSIKAKREDKKETEQADKQADAAKTASQQSLDQLQTVLVGLPGLSRLFGQVKAMAALAAVPLHR